MTATQQIINIGALVPFEDNRYTTIYYSLVTNPNKKQKRAGTEKHHIIPESFFVDRKRKGPAGWIDGNSDAVNNLVYLTVREHVLAHRLLSRITRGLAKKKMCLALWGMLNTRTDDGSTFKVSSREYERLKQIHIDEISRPLSEETKDAIRRTMATPEYKEKVSGINNAMSRPEIRTRWKEAVEKSRDKHIAAVQSDDHRRKIKETTTQAMNRPEIKAKHCAALARPETKAKKSKNTTGILNPMSDRAIYTVTNERLGITETGTWYDLSKQIPDIKSLQRYRKTRKNVCNRRGWKVIS